jgi:hypothetical protein
MTYYPVPVPVLMPSHRRAARQRRRRLLARLLLDGGVVPGAGEDGLQRVRSTRPSSHTGPSDSNTAPSAP